MESEFSDAVEEGVSWAKQTRTRGFPQPQIDAVWEQTRHVAMGTKPDAAAIAAMDQAYRAAAGDPVGALAR
jgi:hypothetical protein